MGGGPLASPGQLIPKPLTHFCPTKGVQGVTAARLWSSSTKVEQEGGDEKAAFSSPLTGKGYRTVITAPAPPLRTVFLHRDPDPDPSREPTSYRRGGPNCSPGRPRPARRSTHSCAPPTPTPAPAPRPSNVGAGERPARRPLPELPGGKHHGASGPAGRGAGVCLPGPHPEPLLRGDPPSSPQPLTCSCSQLRRRSRRLRPRRFRSALVPFPPTPPGRFRHGCSPGRAPRLPPSFPPPSTGSRDGDRSCAAHPHPQTGILPTSPIARELRGGERQLSREGRHHGSGCSRGSRVSEPEPGGGRRGGCRRREVGMRPWGLRWESRAPGPCLEFKDWSCVLAALQGGWAERQSQKLVRVNSPCGGPPSSPGPHLLFLDHGQLHPPESPRCITAATQRS